LDSQTEALRRFQALDKTNATERLKTDAIYVKEQPNQRRAEFFALPIMGFVNPPPPDSWILAPGSYS
jgi:hypothetical protein